MRAEDGFVDQVVSPLLERGPDRIAKHMADIPVPLGMEELAAVVHRTPQKRMAAQRVDIPVPPMMEEIVEVVPHEIALYRLCTSWNL